MRCCTNLCWAIILLVMGCSCGVWVYISWCADNPLLIWFFSTVGICCFGMFFVFLCFICDCGPIKDYEPKEGIVEDVERNRIFKTSV